MTLVYTDKLLKDGEGKIYAVLDTDGSDFENDPATAFGKKVTPTFAFRGKKGQKAYTYVGNIAETSYVCAGGEVVFVNRLPDGQMDIYVPRDKEGTSTGEEILRGGYKLVKGALDDPRGALYVPTAGLSTILFEVIQKPTAIANAYGEGQHVFLAEGATLKLSGKNVSGINRSAFDATWAITDQEGAVVRLPTFPEPDFYGLEKFQSVLGAKAHAFKRAIYHTLLPRTDTEWYRADQKPRMRSTYHMLTSAPMASVDVFTHTLTPDEVRCELSGGEAEIVPTIPRCLFNRVAGKSLIP